MVTITVNGDVELPANAVAGSSSPRCSARSSSSWPRRATRSRRAPLEDGALIPLERTNRNVEVEELLGALSLVLNGGGLAQLQTINHELGDALEGREDGIKDTLDQLDTFIGGLDEQKAEINRALDSVERARRDPGRPDGDDRDRARHDRPGPRRHQRAARPAGRHARGPGPARRRRHADHQPVGGEHHRRPAAAAADPHPAGRGRPGPRRSLDAAADLSVPGQLAVRAELPRRADRRVRAVHQHDGDHRPRPDQPALPLRDRPGHRRARGAGAAGRRRRRVRPGRAARRATRQARRRTRRRGGSTGLARRCPATSPGHVVERHRGRAPTACPACRDPGRPAR